MEKVDPDPFFKISKLRASLVQQSEISYSLFLLHVLVEDDMFSFYKYRTYSSRSGRSFNFEFSKGGAYPRKTLFRRRCSNISKRHQNTFNLCLEPNNKNSNNNRRINCLMFKIMFKTPLFTTK